MDACVLCLGQDVLKNNPSGCQQYRLAGDERHSSHSSDCSVGKVLTWSSFCDRSS